MNRPDKARDDISSFLRFARTSTTRAEVDLDALSAFQRAAATRMPTPRGAAEANGAHDVADELRARDEELVAAEEELREQVDALTRAVSLLERERAKYVDLFANAPDAYVVTDLQGNIQEFNVAAERLFGVEAGSVVGRPLVAFVTAHHTRPFCNALRSLAQSQAPGAARSITLGILPRDRPLFVVWVRAAAVFGAAPTPIAVRWLLRPVVSSDLERANRIAYGELASLLARDLRAPLTTIGGWAQMLHRGTVQDDAERQRALDWIANAAVAQMAMLDDLGELSEVCDDEQHRPQAVNLVELTRKAIGAVQSATEWTAIDFQNATADDEALLVRVDRQRLSRALELLLRRAVEGTPQSGAPVRVCALANGGQVLLSIETGDEARVPARWGVRLATAARTIEAAGGSVTLLGDERPSCRVHLPLLTR